MEVQSKVHRSRNRGTSLLLRTGLIVALLLLLCAQWTREPIRAAPSIEADAYWSLTPDPLAIAGCEIAVLTVRINDVINLYGADVLLTFDPNVLEVVDADGNSGNGIQVENAGMLSSRIWVARNEANNGAGTVRYAVTLLNPAPPVNGSGDFIRIYFRAKTAGTSVLHFSYIKLAAPGGEEIISTAVDGSAITTAPDAATVTISRLNSTTARLSWSTVTGVDGYHIYRDTIPYFTPSGTPYATVTAGPYDDAGALGNIATNYFYVIRSACTNGFESANSNRVGEFDYRIRETATSDLNWIAIPLDSSLLKASDLYTHLVQNTTLAMSVFTIERWNPLAQNYQVYLPSIPATDFSLTLGGVYRVSVDITGATSAVWTIVGAVPPPDAFYYTLRKTATSDLNWIMVPLDRTTIVNALGLRTAIENEATPTTSVLTLEEWNTVGQNFTTYLSSSGAVNFATRFGYPYRVTVGIEGSTSSIWP